jgi:hypothetical protein
MQCPATPVCSDVGRRAEESEMVTDSDCDLYRHSCRSSFPGQMTLASLGVGLLCCSPAATFIVPRSSALPL